MKVCTNVCIVVKEDSYSSVVTNSVEIHTLSLIDSTLRIRAGFDGDFTGKSYSLIVTAWEDRMDDFLKGRRTRVEVANAILSDGDREVVIRGCILKVVMEEDSFRICVYDKEGTLFHVNIVDLTYIENSNYCRTHTSEISPEDYFYGFGEESGSFNKAQKPTSMSPRDAMGYSPRETDSPYEHIPFYVKLNRGTRGAVGYLYHNTCEYGFDMGCEKSNYWKLHSRYRIDGDDIDLFLITDPSMHQVVERYMDLTGKSVMSPRCAFKYLGSSMYYPELDNDYNDAILDFIDTAREKKIPVDGFQLSSGYCTVETDKGTKHCVFTRNKKRFRDPREFFAQMKKRGVTMSPSVKPGILPVHPKLNEMKAKGMFIKASDSGEPGIGTRWDGKGIFADSVNPSTRTYWKEMPKEDVLEYDTSPMWNDGCEYDSLMDKDCRCDFRGKGGTVGQLKPVVSNIIRCITDKAIHETFTNTRPYIVCRSGHCGIQRYAQVWAGNNPACWDSLKYNIATILDMSLSGIANQGCDISDFHGPSPETELMVYWIQNGIFQPHFSIHSTNTDNMVTEPWIYGDCTDYILEAIGLRYQLNPYLYSLMERAHETRLSIMGPVCSAPQEDVKCCEEDVDFMLDGSLLVANVVEEGAVSKRAYLPEGETFYDFYTKAAYEGGCTVKLPINLGSIPPFVRSGAIIPMAEDRLDNLKTQQAERIRILCVAGRDGRFELYEDDGISMDYEKGSCPKTSVAMTAGEHTVSGFRQEGHYKAAVKTLYLDMIHREKIPCWARADGEAIPHFLHKRKFEDADCGRYYSQGLKFVRIKYLNPKKDYQVIISFEQFDLIDMQRQAFASPPACGEETAT